MHPLAPERIPKLGIEDCPSRAEPPKVSLELRLPLGAYGARLFQAVTISHENAIQVGVDLGE